MDSRWGFKNVSYVKVKVSGILTAVLYSNLKFLGLWLFDVSVLGTWIFKGPETQEGLRIHVREIGFYHVGASIYAAVTKLKWL